MSRVAVKVTIEGAANVWVTSTVLAGAESDDRVARPALQYAGLVVNERTNPREGTIEVDGMTLQIVATPEANDEFSRGPTLLTYLSESVNSTSATTFKVRSNSLIQDGDYLHVGTECVQVVDASTLDVEVTRAARGTEAQVHSRADGAGASEVPVWNKVQSWEGRRVSIEATESGATSQVFRGVITQAPYTSDDGTLWLIDIAHISKSLEQDVGVPIDVATTIRGYKLGESSAFAMTVGGTEQFRITGFYEDEGEFLADLNDSLDNVTISGVESMWADIADDPAIGHCFRLWLRIGASPISVPTITIGSTIDGITPIGGFALWSPDYGPLLVASGVPLRTPPADVSTLLANQLYVVNIGPYGRLHTPALALSREVGESLGFPRSLLYSTPDSPLLTDPWVDGAAASVDETKDNVIALADDITAGVGDILVLNGWPLRDELRLTVTADHGDGIYEFSTAGLGEYCDRNNVTSIFVSGDVRVGLQKSLGKGDLSDFVDAVIASAPYANSGLVPYLTAADIDPSAAAVAAGALGFQALTLRDYNVTDSISISDLIAPELHLLGLTVGTDGDAKIRFVPYSIPSQTDRALYSFGKSEIVTRYSGTGAWPKWITSTDGIVSIVALVAGKRVGFRLPTSLFGSVGLFGAQVNLGSVSGALGGDLLRDPTAFIYRDISSVSAHKNRGLSTLTIDPKVNAETDLSRAEAMQIASRIIATFGFPYEVVTIKVRRYADSLAVRIGDIVSITSPHVPDSTDGTRGITTRRARVLGRRVSYDPSDDGATVEITVIMRSGAAIGPNVSGYAPSCAITGASKVDVVGDVWDLTVTQNLYAPSGVDDTSFLTVGDTVIARQNDTVTPNEQDGTIVSVGATVVRVSFSSTAPWGVTFSGSYTLDFANATIGASDAQRLYVYEADSGFLLEDGNPARIFA